MCGRYKLVAGDEELAAEFRLDESHPVAARYNIAPTQPVEIVRLRPESPIRELKPVVWGLIPPWADDLSIASRLINARAETLLEKKSFCNPFKRRRCLIPADGFYEWQTRGKAKQPFLIQISDRRVFAFAGVWEVWHGPNGEEIESCAIITVPANDLVAPIHDRMPAIIPPDSYNSWLNTAETEAPELLKLLTPPESSRMTALPVSTTVNNARNDSPECARTVQSTPNPSTLPDFFSSS